jgi:hypothetical protein
VVGLHRQGGIAYFYVGIFLIFLPKKYPDNVFLIYIVKKT